MPPKNKFDERLAAEANPDMVQDPEVQDDETADPPPKRPVGAPDLVPWHSASRTAKAAFLRVIDKAGETGDGLAATYELLALVEDAVLAVAQVPAAAKAWFTKADDRDLMDLYGWYSSQMGEAPASPSS